MADTIRRASDDALFKMVSDVGEIKGKLDALVDTMPGIQNRVDEHDRQIASARGWIKGLGGASLVSVVDLAWRIFHG